MEFADSDDVRRPAFRFCPACGGPLETRQLKAGEPLRPVCPRCGYVHYLDPKVAVGTVIDTAGRPDRARASRNRAGLRVVGVPRRLRRPRRRGHGRPRSAKRGKKRASTSGSTASSTSTPIPAGRSWSSCTRRPSSAATLRIDEESLEARLFSRAEIPWDQLAFRSTHEALEDYYTGIASSDPVISEFASGRRKSQSICRAPVAETPPDRAWMRWYNFGSFSPVPGDLSVR